MQQIFQKAGRDELRFKGILNLKARLSYFIHIRPSLSFQLFILSPFSLSYLLSPPLCCAPVSLKPATDRAIIYYAVFKK